MHTNTTAQIQKNNNKIANETYETCSHKTRIKSPEIPDSFYTFSGRSRSFVSPSPIPSGWYSWVSPTGDGTS